MSEQYNPDQLRREFERRQMEDAGGSGASIFLVLAGLVVLGFIMFALFSSDTASNPGVAPVGEDAAPVAPVGTEDAAPAVTQ